MLTETTEITENLDLVSDLETRYLSGGPQNAPVIVFMHDGAYGGASDVTWGKILPEAAKKYRVIAPDLLGYGGSAKSVRADVSPFAFRIRHIFSLLDHLGITEPVHFVGNSFGGSIGLRALADEQYRHRIASVSTFNGSGGPWKAPDMTKLGAFDGTRESLEQLVDLLCDPVDDKADHLAARYKWAITPGHFITMRAPHTQLPEALKVERPADTFPAQLKEVNTPALLVECSKDTLLQEGWSKNLAESMGNARREVLNRKHCPNITHPEEAWDLIDDFLTSVIEGSAN
ncbi:alpha/beta fold hydrolase [Glutamicibacter sp.]|uniref:alpha/beta fold hydrolase n=1 Tax=Glutamicibacter sp. TaxID=1931995 RepID=UPI002B48D15D|nr:alpha/beta hydrolase [Glutamicibacter sp.]HJX79249.1 alpha/beta hydrolase [Glutamicibacter sp.]